MPLYRTAPDRSLDDLVAQIEAKGEEIIDRHREKVIDRYRDEHYEWSVLTKPMHRTPIQVETRPGNTGVVITDFGSGTQGNAVRREG